MIILMSWEDKRIHKKITKLEIKSIDTAMNGICKIVIIRTKRHDYK